jgi:hypothetical protein
MLECWVSFKKEEDMKTVINILLITAFITSFALAKSNYYIDKEVIQIDKDGKISKESPFRKLTFNIIKDRIYVEGRITRDTSAYKKGENFAWEKPYVIMSKGVTIPHEPSFWELSFWTGKPEPQQNVMCAVRMAPGLNSVPETLLLGDKFYMMSRPGMIGLDYLTIFRGERED